MKIQAFPLGCVVFLLTGGLGTFLDNAAAKHATHIHYGDSVVIAFGNKDARTKNCGWYGCRVLSVQDSGVVSVDHGGMNPAPFIFTTPGTLSPRECVKYGDPLSITSGEHDSLVAQSISTVMHFSSDSETPGIFYLFPPTTGDKKIGDCLEFKDKVFISTVNSRGYTSNCGMYGCRVSQDPTKSQRMTFSHGNSQPAAFTLQKANVGFAPYIGANSPKVGIRAWNNNYLAVDENGKFYQGKHTGGPEGWSLVKLVQSGDSVSVQLSKGKYLAVNDSGRFFEGGHNSGWARVKVEGDPEKFALRFWNGKYLAFNKNGSLYLGNTPTGWAQLSIVPYSGPKTYRRFSRWRLNENKTLSLGDPDRCFRHTGDGNFGLRLCSESGHHTWNFNDDGTLQFREENWAGRWNPWGLAGGACLQYLGSDKFGFVSCIESVQKGTQWTLHGNGRLQYRIGEWAGRWNPWELRGGVCVEPGGSGNLRRVACADGMQSDFSNGKFEPFKICTTQHPNTAEVLKYRVKTTWKQAAYNGERMTKGVELCPYVKTYGEGYFSLKFLLPGIGDGRGRYPRYRDDSEGAIVQIFQMGPCNSWAAKIVVKNNQLMFIQRGHCGKATLQPILGVIERDRFYKIEINFVPSNKKQGRLMVRIDGEVTYDERDINFGFGRWEDDDTLASGHELVGKFGQYNYDHENYVPDEVRTVYFDDVIWINGSDLNNAANPW